METELLEEEPPNLTMDTEVSEEEAEQRARSRAYDLGFPMPKLTGPSTEWESTVEHLVTASFSHR